MAEAILRSKHLHDASDFDRKMHDGPAKVKEFSASFRQIKAAISAAFAVTAVFQFLQVLKEVRKYQEDSGVKLMDEGTLQQVEGVSAIIDQIKMTMTAGAGEFVAILVRGVKMTAALIGNGFDIAAAARVVDKEINDAAEKVESVKLDKQLTDEREKAKTEDEKYQDAIREARAAKQQHENLVEDASKLSGMFGPMAITQGELDNSEKKMELADLKVSTLGKGRRSKLDAELKTAFEQASTPDDKYADATDDVKRLKREQEKKITTESSTKDELDEMAKRIQLAQLKAQALYPATSMASEKKAAADAAAAGQAEEEKKAAADKKREEKKAAAEKKRVEMAPLNQQRKDILRAEQKDAPNTFQATALGRIGGQVGKARNTLAMNASLRDKTEEQNRLRNAKLDAITAKIEAIRQEVTE